MRKKALVTLAFALEIESEDDLAVLAETIDEAIYEAVRQRVGLKEHVQQGELDEKWDWYGAVVSMRRSLYEGIEEVEA